MVAVCSKETISVVRLVQVQQLLGHRVCHADDDQGRRAGPQSDRGRHSHPARCGLQPPGRPPGRGWLPAGWLSISSSTTSLCCCLQMYVAQLQLCPAPGSATVDVTYGWAMCDLAKSFCSPARHPALQAASQPHCMQSCWQHTDGLQLNCISKAVFVTLDSGCRSIARRRTGATASARRAL